MTSPVHVGKTLESLRNSNFDTVSAIGEVIDNSIEAEAKNIRIRIKKTEVRKNHYDLQEVAFCDDGVGMDVETLGKCLQLGFSVRYNNRKGIGRFGVGMTLGAITQCTRIEVYSKPMGGGWNFTYLDLKEMSGQEDPVIPSPKIIEIPREYVDLVSEYGTLIIWKNWDREDTKIEDMIIWIGRTYRKFIGSEIILDGKVIKNPNQRYIFLDDGETNKEISAYDPLYVTKTAYNNEVTELETPLTLEEEIHKFDKPSDTHGGFRTITINSSLLPESWRLVAGSGNSTENRKRLVPQNEGISILRNGREVFYGHIPYYKIPDKTNTHYKSFIDLDRFWGCEISFGAELDYWFSVKNIKVGARPLPELRKAIQNQFNVTIKAFREEIRKTRETKKAKEMEKTGGVFGGTDDAEEILRRTGPLVKPKPDEIEALITDSGHTKDEITRGLKERLTTSPLVLTKNYQKDERSNFIDITTRGGSTILDLTMKHPFFVKFFDIHEKLKKEILKNNPNSDTLLKELETNLHLLLSSFAMTYKNLNLEEMQTGNMFIEKLIHNWTFNLSHTAPYTLEEKHD